MSHIEHEQGDRRCRTAPWVVVSFVNGWAEIASSYLLVAAELLEESSSSWRRRHHRRAVASRDVRKVRKISSKRRIFCRRTSRRLLAKNFGHPDEVVDGPEVRRKFAVPETSEDPETSRLKRRTPPSQKIVNKFRWKTNHGSLKMRHDVGPMMSICENMFCFLLKN